MTSFKSVTIYTKLFLCVVLLCGLISADIPSDIPKCLAGDVTCIAKTINAILRRYPKGNPEFGLQRIEGVQLKNVIVAQANDNNPEHLNFRFNTLNCFGLENLNVTRVVGFKEELRQSKFEVYGTIPELRIQGDYEINGKVLLLPLMGKGDAQLKLTNATFGFKFKVTEAIRDGKRYAILNKIRSTLVPQDFHIKMENLFNSNEELGDSVNRIVNDNWKHIWSELEDGINNAVSKIIKMLLVNVLHELSYDDFYKIH